MIARGRITLAMAAAAALALNLMLFAVAALLARERPLHIEMSDPVPVSLVSLRPPAPPAPPEEIPPEARPELEPRRDFMPAPSRPAPSRPDLPSLALAIDLGGLDISPAQGAFVFNVDDLDQPPREVSRGAPNYPLRALNRGITGVVRVKFLVGADGVVSRVEILSAEPRDVFEEAVLQAVPKWRYEPGRLEGRAVPAWLATDIFFEN